MQTMSEFTRRPTPAQAATINADPLYFVVSWKTRSIDDPRDWHEIPASHARQRLTMSEAIATTNALLIIKGTYQILMSVGNSQFLYTEESEARL